MVMLCLVNFQSLLCHTFNFYFPYFAQQHQQTSVSQSIYVFFILLLMNVNDDDNHEGRVKEEKTNLYTLTNGEMVNGEFVSCMSSS